MKNIMLTLFLLGCSFLAKSQDFEVAFQPDFYSQGIDVFSNPDGSFTAYVRITARPDYLYHSVIVHLDENVFESTGVEFPDWWNGWIQESSDIIATADGHYLAIGHFIVCGLWEDQFAFDKLDKEGNEILSSLNFYGAIVVNADSTFYSNGYDLVGQNLTQIVNKVSNEGELLYACPVNDQVEQIANLVNNKIVLYSESKAYLLSDTGSEIVIDSLLILPNDSAIEEVKGYEDDYVIVFNESSGYRINLENNEVEYYGFSGEYVASTYTGSYTVILHDVDTHYEVLVYDSSMELIMGFPIDGDFELSNIKYQDGELLVVGDELYNSSSPNPENSFVFHAQRVPFVKSYGLDGTTADMVTDAGVTGVFSAEPPFKTEVSNFLTSDDLSRLEFKGIEVEVTNFGAVPIDKIAVNARAERIPISFDYGCFSYNSIDVKFDSLDLQPGESTILSLGDFEFDRVPGPDSTYQLCLWTSIPNNRLDANHNNDVGCATFKLDPYASAYEEEETYSDDLQVYPNPVQDFLILDLDKYGLTESFNVEIWNSIGQQVLLIEEYHLLNSINLNGLTKGAYFVKVQLGDELYDGRFLKW